MPALLDDHERALLMPLHHLLNSWKKHMILATHEIESRVVTLLFTEVSEQRIDIMRQPEPAQKLFLCHFFGFTDKHVPGLLMIGPWKYDPGEQLVEPDKRDYPLEFMTGPYQEA